LTAGFGFFMIFELSTLPIALVFWDRYYHLLSRGNERSDIFVDEPNRLVFLDVAGEVSERFELEQS
jgi:hypothetical protein